MRLADFDFVLPDALIARHPLPERSASRLMVLRAEDAHATHQSFRDLPSLLRAGDLLVFNNTRVLAARLFGRKATGGEVEILVERVLSTHEALCQARASKPIREGASVQLQGGGELRLLAREGGWFRFESDQPWDDLMAGQGHMPLPPYIDRADELADRERYQTVYAKVPGAVAAPTAGLHFDEALLAQIDALGVRRVEVTLHVGAGTFQPVRVDNIADHRMHSERYEISETVVQAIAETRARGGRVIAVGTTAVRALESAVMAGALESGARETQIFITPGYRFRVVDALITNFHLPQSTLLMLVSAFAGRERVLAAYADAVRNAYRFFSYGDAMFLTRSESGHEV